MDSLRVYDYALRQPVISQLAALYDLDQPSPLPKPGSALPQLMAALRQTPEWDIAKIAGLPFSPLYNLPLAVNPTPYVGNETAYSWLAFDPSDSPADQTLHRGLVALEGNSTQYVDLNALTGPQSVGQVSPVLFGQSGGSGESEGWSVELVFKPLQQTEWSKFLIFASGAYIDALYLGWQEYATLMEIYEYSNYAGGPAFEGQAIAAIEDVSLGSWYHVALVMQPHTPDIHQSINATFTVYVNGLQVYYADSGVTMPLPVFRQDSFLGRSAWTADQNVVGVYDALRVWDRALTAEQAGRLAAVYGL